LIVENVGLEFGEVARQFSMARRAAPERFSKIDPTTQNSQLIRSIDIRSIEPTLENMAGTANEHMRQEIGGIKSL